MKGGCPEVDSGAGQNLGDPDLPHAWKQRAQLPDEMADEVGESVDRLGDLNQRTFADFVRRWHACRWFSPYPFG